VSHGIGNRRLSIARAGDKAGCNRRISNSDSTIGVFNFPHLQFPQVNHCLPSATHASKHPKTSSLTTASVSKMNLKAFLTGALEATDHFGRNTLAPAVSEGVEAVGNFGKNTLTPAAGEVIYKADQFRQSHLGPALSEGVKAAGDFKQNVLVPVLGKGGKAIEDLGQQLLGPPEEEATDKSTFARILDKAKKLSEEAPKWVKEHPGQTAMYAVSGVTLVAPGILAGPVLWAFGWGATGMRAGRFSFSTNLLRF